MNNLVIAYPHEGAPVVLLSGAAPYSHHIALYKATDDAAAYKRVELWRHHSGRVKAKNLTPFQAGSFEETPSAIIPEKDSVTELAPDSDPNDSLSPASDASDITNGAGDSAENVDTQPSDTHTKTDQSTAPAAVGPVAGQSEVVSDEVTASEGAPEENEQPELVKAPAQKGRKAANKGSKTPSKK